MFQRCLVCTDFSDGLHRLVNFVPDLASGGFQRIVFLHSISVWEGGKVARVDKEKIVAARESLKAALQSVPEGVEVKVEVLSGSPVESILRMVDTYQIDLIFIGTPIRSALEARVFGSTTLELAKATATPLMILRPQLISTYTSEELALRCQHLWRYLLIPYDDSDASQYLINRLKESALNRPGNSVEKCLLLWVIDDGGRQTEISQYRLQAAQQKLAALKTELEALDIAVSCEVRQGNPLHEILAVAINQNISAIAVADSRNNLLDRLISNVAKEMLHRFWFPLLLFPSKRG